MRKLLTFAAVLLVLAVVFCLPCYASEEAVETEEVVAPANTEAAEEQATEAVVEPSTEVVDETTESTTESTTEATEETAEVTEEETTAEEETTEETTEEETTEVIGITDGYTNEQARDWLINAIMTAKPEEVEFIKGYIEDALVSMEGLAYTEWEWIYKIVADNIEWVSCLTVGIGFLAAAFFAIFKYRREKTLINNAASAANASEAKMGEMTEKVAEYEETIKALAETVTKALAQMQEHDGQLAAVGQELIKRDETVIAASTADVHAMILLADIVGDLIQLSNIPQVRKDEIYSKHETAKNHIFTQTMGGESHDETEA